MQGTPNMNLANNDKDLTIKILREHINEYRVHTALLRQRIAGLESALAQLASASPESENQQLTREEIIQQQAQRIIVLESKLKPFSDAVMDEDVIKSDEDEPLYLRKCGENKVIEASGGFLTVADLRNARAALMRRAK